MNRQRVITFFKKALGKSPRQYRVERWEVSVCKFQYNVSAVAVL